MKTINRRDLSTFCIGAPLTGDVPGSTVGAFGTGTPAPLGRGDENSH